MKHLILICSLLCSVYILPGQTVSLTAGCGIGTVELALVGNDGMGRNIYQAPFGEIQIRLAYSHTRSRWEIHFIDQGTDVLFAHTTYDSSPNPPDDETASAAGEPYTDDSSLDCDVSDVSGSGTQDNLGGEPCEPFNGDTDNDGVCDDFDRCPAGDDLQDQDEDDIPDACDERPTIPDGVLLHETCLSTDSILFLLEGVDETGRNIYENVNTQLTIRYNAMAEQWEVRAQDPGTQVFFINDLPSFPDPPSSETNPWVGAAGSPCAGANSTVTGTGTQSELGCDLSIGTVTVVQPSCPENSDGQITIEVAGGSGMLTYQLSGQADNTSGVFTDLPEGMYTITVIDMAFPDGQCTATDSQTLAAEDITPPTITCPDDITVDINDDQCAATVNYTPPTGADNCAGAAVVLSSGLGSDAAFPPGVNTETYTVTDAAGLTAECSFTVTVNVPDTAADSDCDTVADVCDVCPGGDDTVDNDNDGLPDCANFPGLDQIIEDWKCEENDTPGVLLCHTDGADPETRTTICVPESEVADHLAHGDYLGPCEAASCTTNTVEERAAFSDLLRLYPNPAMHAVRIEWEDVPELRGSVHLRISDGTGRLIHQRNNILNASTMQLDHLPAGLYYLRLVSQTQVLAVKKLIIVR